MTREEHLARIYIVGARTVGKTPGVLVLLCGGTDCAGAELLVRHPTVAAIVAEADAHIDKMAALGAS